MKIALTKNECRLKSENTYCQSIQSISSSHRLPQSIKVSVCVYMCICDDCEVGEYTRAGSRQRLGKHVPAAMN
jgi:hypothetical protein